MPSRLWISLIHLIVNCFVFYCLTYQFCDDDIEILQARWELAFYDPTEDFGGKFGFLSFCL